MLRSERIVVTGAAGGIGQCLAREFASRGARLGLVDIRPEPLEAIAGELKEAGAEVTAVCADLMGPEGRSAVVKGMQQAFGGTDILINNAGSMQFVDFADQSAESIDRMFGINVLAPMQLTRELLPEMVGRGQGRIVNIGSVFGSIGFAHFAAYSATKAALRTFSEALRRELADTGVRVHYLAPRAVKTPLNSPAVLAMAEKAKMNMDEPERVAQSIVEAILKDKPEAYFGFPESLLVRINAILPRLVDKALRKQNRMMREFTRA